jgi:chemotaxis protein MotB
VQDHVRYSGVIEIPGLPTRPKLRSVAPIVPDDASATPTPDAGGRTRSSGAKLDTEGAFALASASLRQALQDLPDLAELSKHVMIEETPKGLNIEIVDQDGRSMFAEGSKEPYERTRRLIQQLAGPLKSMPFRIAISGHTSALRTPALPGYGPWELSADRANSVRRLLEGEGVPPSHFFMVAGKADTEPLFPDDPYIATNRRVTITLVQEAPPVPPDIKP